jgi:hypothetical protein
MAKNVQLGSIVRDRITGFQGIAFGRHEYLTGCNKITIQPQGVDKDGAPRKSEWFDEQTLDVLEPMREGLIDEGDVVGGPMDEPRRTL